MSDKHEFEVWMNTNMPMCHFLKNQNGVYTDPRTDTFWFVWQASRNQALEDAAKICEKAPIKIISSEPETIEFAAVWCAARTREMKSAI